MSGGLDSDVGPFLTANVSTESLGLWKQSRRLGVRGPPGGLGRLRSVLTGLPGFQEGLDLRGNGRMAGLWHLIAKQRRQ